MTTYLLHTLATRPSLSALSPPGQLLVMTMRVAVVARRRGADALAALTDRLGCPQRARHLLHIVEVIGFVWPERFMLSPPCCGSLSHDEQLVGALAGWAARRDRLAFDRESSDLLNEDAREQLWREFNRWE